MARELIDRIFDLELKKEALVKAQRQYQVRVEAQLLARLDRSLTNVLNKFLELQPQSLTLTDLVKASLSIRLQADPPSSITDQQKALMRLKLRYLVHIVLSFKTLRERHQDKYQAEFKYAVRQLKRIKGFCDEYRSRSPIMLRKYQSVKCLKQLAVSSGIHGSPAKEVGCDQFKQVTTGKSNSRNNVLLQSPNDNQTLSTQDLSHQATPYS